MINIVDAAKQLNKSVDYVKQLCEERDIYIDYGPDGVFVPDDFIEQEITHPDRYNFRKLSCTEIQKTLLVDRTGLEAFYIGCVIKYLYRNLSIGDLEKARTYLDMAIQQRGKK